MHVESECVSPVGFFFLSITVCVETGLLAAESHHFYRFPLCGTNRDNKVVFFNLFYSMKLSGKICIPEQLRFLKKKKYSHKFAK